MSERFYTADDSPAFKLAVFSPAEAARIALMPSDLLRVWRRRGFIDAETSGVGYNAFDLASLLVLKLFSDAGVGPSKGHEFSRLCAQPIVYRALGRRSAYEPDVRFEEGADRRYMPSDSPEVGFWPVNLIFDQLGLDHSIPRPDEKRNSGPHALSREASVSPTSGEIQFDPESLSYAADAGVLPAAVSIRLNLWGVGDYLARAAGRPLVTIESGDAK